MLPKVRLLKPLLLLLLLKIADIIETVAHISWYRLYFTAYLYFLNYRIESLAYFNVYTVIYLIGFLLYAIYDPSLTRKANTGARKKGFLQKLVRLFILMEILFLQENQLKSMIILSNHSLNSHLYSWILFLP